MSDAGEGGARPIATHTKRVRLLGGRPRQGGTVSPAELEVARIAARALNECNAEPLIERLAPNVVKTSQGSLEDLEGRDAVADWLRKAIANQWKGGEEPPLAEVGLLRTGALQAGAIISLQGVRNIFWAYSLDAQGRIARQDGYTVFPHPDRAQGTGERPGFDAERFERAERAAKEARWAFVRSLEGPLEFVIFAHRQPVLDDLVRCYRSEVLPQYPGASVRPVFLDLDSGRRADPDDEAEQLAGSAGVCGIPCVAVRRAGQWIRRPDRSPAPEAVLADLADLGLPAAGPPRARES